MEYLDSSFSFPSDKGIDVGYQLNMRRENDRSCVDSKIVITGCFAPTSFCSISQRIYSLFEHECPEIEVQTKRLNIKIAFNKY